MANLTITVGNVIAASTASKASGLAGETITAGMPVYTHTDGLFYKADTDTALHAAATGISLHAASANQPLQIITSGALTLGSILTKGSLIYLSVDVGIMNQLTDGDSPDGFLTTNDFRTVLGTATSATVMNVAIIQSGVNAA